MYASLRVFPHLLDLLLQLLSLDPVLVQPLPHQDVLGCLVTLQDLYISHTFAQVRGLLLHQLFLPLDLANVHSVVADLLQNLYFLSSVFQYTFVELFYDVPGDEDGIRVVSSKVLLRHFQDGLFQFHQDLQAELQVIFLLIEFV